MMGFNDIFMRFLQKIDYENNNINSMYILQQFIIQCRHKIRNQK